MQNKDEALSAGAKFSRRLTLQTMLALGLAGGVGLLPDKALASSQTNPLKKMITRPNGLDGSKDLIVKDFKGSPQKLSDFRGRFVLLNVWATWCRACRDEMPDLDALQGKFDPEKLLVMPLSIDRRGLDAIMPFYDQTGIQNLAIYTAKGVGTIHAFGERGLPFTILLDPNGKEIGRILGPVKWDADEFVAYLNDRIAQWQKS